MFNLQGRGRTGINSFQFYKKPGEKSYGCEHAVHPQEYVSAILFRDMVALAAGTGRTGTADGVSAESKHLLSAVP
jgi:hypothetical protein